MEEEDVTGVVEEGVEERAAVDMPQMDESEARQEEVVVEEEDEVVANVVENEVSHGSIVNEKRSAHLDDVQLALAGTLRALLRATMRRCSATTPEPERETLTANVVSHDMTEVVGDESTAAAVAASFDIGDGNWCAGQRVMLWGICLVSEDDDEERADMLRSNLILYKFIIGAEKGGPRIACQILINTIRWRLAHNIDTLIGAYDTDEDFRAYCDVMDASAAFSVRDLKRDAMGRQIMVHRYGDLQHDDGIFEQNFGIGKASDTGSDGSYSLFTRWWLRNVEIVLAGVNLDDFSTSSAIVVHDLSGFRLNRLNARMRGALGTTTKLLVHNYPDLTRTHLVINAPFFINILLAIVWPLLPQRTKKKIHIVSSSDTGRVLAEQLGPGLPDEYKMKETERLEPATESSSWWW